MSRFTTEKALYPIHVDFELLSNLESFLLKSIPKEIVRLFPSGLKRIYSIDLTDKYGTEELKTIKDYRLKFLTDSTSQISLGLFDEKTNFEISIVLDKEDGASIFLDFELEQARGIAVQILEEIDRILGNYKSANRFFHPPEIISMILFFAGFISGLTSVIDFINSKYLEALGPGLIFFSLGSYYYVGNWIRTIVSFDTRHYQRFNKYFHWFISGNLSFLIFGTLLSFLRDKLFQMIF
ncbi:hypothetical protein CH381_25385 [Leptospira sp. mixed culture ATI2-C-A1]|nr:hypothetical protein CH381_25385 [Leptospira sp. mixed culture ATI2-C-A1]